MKFSWPSMASATLFAQVTLVGFAFQSDIGLEQQNIASRYRILSIYHPRVLIETDWPHKKFASYNGCVRAKGNMLLAGKEFADNQKS